MPRRKKHIELVLPIPPFDDAPGPDADIDVLRAHNKQIQTAFATHRYDDVIMVCHWCCKDVELPFADKDRPRGARKFCSERCMETAAKFKRLQYNRVNPLPTSSPTAENEQPANEELVPAPVTSTRETDGATVPVRRRKALKRAIPQKALKARKPKSRKARKPKAAKDMCSKGLHEMTPDNMYFSKSDVGCQKCRKALRAVRKGAAK